MSHLFNLAFLDVLLRPLGPLCGKKVFGLVLDRNGRARDLNHHHE